MAFMSKFKNKKGSKDELDDEMPDLDSDLDDDSDEEEEKESDVGRFKLNTVKLKKNPDDSAKTEDEEEDAEADDEADEADEDEDDDESAENASVGEAESPDDSLMDLFEVEEVVDHHLISMASWADEVEATELAEELDALVDEMRERWGDEDDYEPEEERRIS